MSDKEETKLKRGRPKKALLTQGEKVTAQKILESLQDDEEMKPVAALGAKAQEYTQEINRLTRNLTGGQKTFLEKYAALGDVKLALKELSPNGKFHNLQKLRMETLLKTPEAQLYIKMVVDLGIARAVLTVDEIIEKARKIFDLGCEGDDLRSAMESVKFLGGYKGMTPEARKASAGLGTSSDSSNYFSGDKAPEVTSDISKFRNLVEKVGLPNMDTVQ